MLQTQNAQTSTTTMTTMAISQAADSPVVAGIAVGDAHISSLRKAHYTVLQEGIFTAWSFSKEMKPSKSFDSSTISRAQAGDEVNWQLLAAYGGVTRFRTHGLMLLDKGNGKNLTMEILAEDCAWRVKEQGLWRKAQVEQVSSGVTAFQVSQLDGRLNNTEILRSAILLRTRGFHGAIRHGAGVSVAKLLVHCTRQNHLDFKMAMYRKKDVQYVGGELGLAPRKKSIYQFLSKRGLMETETRTDQEFKAPGTWISLGGRAAFAASLRVEAGAVEAGGAQRCGDDEAQRAHEVCARHLQEITHPEIFSDCVFDVCHGGDETFAQSAAALIFA